MNDQFKPQRVPVHVRSWQAMFTSVNGMIQQRIVSSMSSHCRVHYTDTDTDMKDNEYE
jgi:hypothetical protein